MGTPTIAHAGSKGPSPVAWDGSGTFMSGDVRLPTELSCDDDASEYARFQLTATKGVTNPLIAFGGSASAPMQLKNPGTSSGVYIYDYVPSGRLDLQQLLDAGVVVTFSENVRPTLTVARGCVGTRRTGAENHGPYPVQGLIVDLSCGQFPSFCSAGDELEAIVCAGVEEGEACPQGTRWELWFLPNIATFDPSLLTSVVFTDVGGSVTTPVVPLFQGIRLDVYTVALPLDVNDYFTVVYDGVTYHLQAAPPPA